MRKRKGELQYVGRCLYGFRFKKKCTESATESQDTNQSQPTTGPTLEEMSAMPLAPGKEERKFAVGRIFHISGRLHWTCHESEDETRSAIISNRWYYFFSSEVQYVSAREPLWSG